jgi:hypothetical protein
MHESRKVLLTSDGYVLVCASSAHTDQWVGLPRESREAASTDTCEACYVTDEGWKRAQSLPRK